MAMKRLEFEGMLNDARLKDPNDADYYNQPERYALARFSYYECYKCKKPYFGGKKECNNVQDQDKPYNPEELVCPVDSASSPDEKHLTNCPKHGGDFIEYNASSAAPSHSGIAGGPRTSVRSATASRTLGNISLRNGKTS
eukprot:CAMPEP_0201282632 /NCGR_PEP_ID=MMETSP1317-20130820/6205_1 /ASSEMBLY_ACC=CAM_ASM_000770 /TAXON_ID=187299 /ORGANISM="Undescribed Undescribed, Strain Undescribed" /LENGTH=139 /DNA_ID=CAMNT_0047595947 /DNA_START=119 /DNA_END=539 /DNA_ORIENTATION=-